MIFSLVLPSFFHSCILEISSLVMGSVFTLAIFVFGDGFYDMRAFLIRGYRKACPAEKVVVGKPSSLGQSTLR